MLEPLPTGGFAWLDACSKSVEEWAAAVEQHDDKGASGFFLECDVAVPEEVHDALSDLPPLPTLQHFGPSPFMAAVSEERGYSKGTAPKLIASLAPKERIVVHVRELREALRRGLQLRTVHRVLSFEQRAIFQP